MGNNNPKVLVAGPTYEGMRYCHDKFTQRIRELSYGNYDFLLVDNSEGEDFFNELRKDGVEVLRLKTDGVSNLKKIVESRNRILDYALENGYDSVLMMDVDVIPPIDIIERLLAHRKDIVSGIYFNIFNVDRKIGLYPVAWKGFSDEEFEEIRGNFDSDLIKDKDSLRRHLTPAEANSKELHEVIIPSCGCMLISRKAFSKLRYGILDVPDGFRTTDDIYFCRKAREEGFRLYCDTGLQCDHLIDGKFKRAGDELINPVHE